MVERFIRNLAFIQRTTYIVRERIGTLGGSTGLQEISREAGSVDDDPVEVRSVVWEVAQYLWSVEGSADGVLTALAGAEGDCVRPGAEVQLHWDTDDDMTSAGAGLVDPNGRTAVDAASADHS